MLAPARQDYIVAALHAHGAVRVADLVGALGVSDMTIRRDIAELSARGLARRVHGGAVLPSTEARTAFEPKFAAKAALATAAKTAIARAATDLVQPGSAIAISAGTTTYRFAATLAERTDLRPLTVVTNSVPVSDVLTGTGIAVELTGGTRTPSDALVGPIAVATATSLRVDQLFLGTHGITADGLNTPNLFEAETIRALAQSATDIIVLADHSKWGTVGLALTIGLDHIDTLISDDGLPPAAARQLAAQVRKLILTREGTP